MHVYCVWLFSLQSCLHISLWVTWNVKSACLLCLTIFFSILSSLQSVSYIKNACLLCLTIFSSIMSPLQLVSYMKLHDYCVFDYFLFNHVSTSGSELRESACLLCVWLFSSQSCLHFRKWVTWKCMFIVCLTIFFSILSPSQVVSYVKVHVYYVRVWLLSSQSCLHLIQRVSYVKVHVYCVFDYFLLNLVST